MLTGVNEERTDIKLTLKMRILSKWTGLWKEQLFEKKTKLEKQTGNWSVWSVPMYGTET